MTTTQITPINPPRVDGKKRKKERPEIPDSASFYANYSSEKFSEGFKPQGKSSNKNQKLYVRNF